MTPLRSLGASDPPSAVASDAALIAGDAEEFGVLFDRHAARLHRYCASRIGRDDADDVVADVFCVAFRDRGRFDAGRTDALPWLYGIATNLLRRHWRQESTRYRAVARASVPEASAEERAIDRTDAHGYLDLITSTLARMPRRQREVLLLFALAELDYPEIAQALGIPAGTVRSTLHRARKRLQKVLPVHARPNSDWKLTS
jgi:RNA polymerase sigma factor (sigma-70 family)